MSIFNYLRNRTFPYILAVLAVATLSRGCEREGTRKELSDVLHEDARVSSMEHADARTRPVMIGRMLQLQSLPELNRIVFDGEIDFEIDNKEIYSRFSSIGELADVSYRKGYFSSEFVDARPKN